MGRHERLETQAAAFGFTGDRLVSVKFRSAALGFVVWLDPAEHKRRVAAGLGAVTDRGTVTALFELPHQVGIPTSAVPQWVTNTTDVLPGAMVEKQRNGSALLRKVRPPLTIVGALVEGHETHRLLNQIGPMSSVCRRSIVIRRTVEPDEPGLLDAYLYGIGVAQQTENNITVITQPAEVTPTITPFLWWLSELAYDAHTNLQPAG